jgi:hypothetical protein
MIEPIRLVSAGSRNQVVRATAPQSPMSTSIIQSNSTNCSFVKPASRISARNVPLANAR